MPNIIGIDVSKAGLDCAYLHDPDQDKAKRKSCQRAKAELRHIKMSEINSEGC